MRRRKSFWKSIGPNLKDFSFFNVLNVLNICFGLFFCLQMFRKLMFLLLNCSISSFQGDSSLINSTFSSTTCIILLTYLQNARAAQVVGTWEPGSEDLFNFWGFLKPKRVKGGYPQKGHIGLQSSVLNPQFVWSNILLTRSSLVLAVQDKMWKRNYCGRFVLFPFVLRRTILKFSAHCEWNCIWVLVAVIHSWMWQLCASNPN